MGIGGVFFWLFFLPYHITQGGFVVITISLLRLTKTSQGPFRAAPVFFFSNV